VSDSTVDAYAWTVERLARGEKILVLDRLPHAAERERLILDEAVEALIAKGRPTEEGIADFLALDDDPEFLGTVFAIASYGAGACVRALSTALSHIGNAAQRGGGGYVLHTEGATALVGRVLWGVTAQAIAGGNPAVLESTRAAALPFWRSEREVVPMAADPRLRYAAACEGDASATFAYYLRWLAGLDLVRSCSPYLAREVEGSLLEADFVLALMAAPLRERTFSRGAHDQSVLTRFAGHVRAWRPELASLFGVGEDELMAEVLRRADDIVGPDRFVGDRSPLHAILAPASP
jgi:hypothetical protein